MVVVFLLEHIQVRDKTKNKKERTTSHSQRLTQFDKKQRLLSEWKNSSNTLSV